MAGLQCINAAAALNAFFAAHEKFSHLQRLRFEDFWPNLPDLPLALPDLPELRALQGNDAAFARLEELELLDTQHLEQHYEAFLQQLSTATFVRRLTKLTLDVPQTPSVRDLLLAPTSLETLTLGTGETYMNYLEDDVMSAFTQPGSFHHLRELELTRCQVKSSVMELLGKADFPALTRLAFQELCSLEDVSTGIVTWKKAKWVAQLKELVFNEGACEMFDFDRNATTPFIKLCELQWPELETFIFQESEWPGGKGYPKNAVRPAGMLEFVNAADHFPKLHTAKIFGQYGPALRNLANLPSLRTLTLFVFSEFDKMDCVPFNEKCCELTSLKVMGWYWWEDLTRWAASQRGKMPALEELSAPAFQPDEDLDHAIVALLRGDK